MESIETGGPHQSRRRRLPLFAATTFVLAILTAWNVTRSDALDRAEHAYNRVDLPGCLGLALDHLDRRPWSREAARLAALCLSRLDFADRAAPDFVQQPVPPRTRPGEGCRWCTGQTSVGGRRRPAIRFLPFLQLQIHGFQAAAHEGTADGAAAHMGGDFLGERPSQFASVEGDYLATLRTWRFVHRPIPPEQATPQHAPHSSLAKQRLFAAGR